jgi:hypothetical protein
MRGAAPSVRAPHVRRTRARVANDEARDRNRAYHVVPDRDHAAFEHLFCGGVAVNLSGKKASYRPGIGTSALVHQRLTPFRIAPVANHSENERGRPAPCLTASRLTAAFRAHSGVQLTLPENSQRRQHACHDRMHGHGNARRESIAAPGASNAIRLERFTNTFHLVDAKDISGAA